MKKRQVSWLAYVTGVALLLGACGNAQRDATEAAINAAQTAINSAQGTTDKFVPEQITAAQDTLQKAKEALAKGDYESALNGARDAAQKTRAAVNSAATKKEEWQKTWDNVRASAPRTLADIQIKMDLYKKYGRLPKGVGLEQMERAQAQFDQVKQDWTDALAAHKGGNFLDTAKKVSSFQEGLQRVKDLLTPPPKEQQILKPGMSPSGTTGAP